MVLGLCRRADDRLGVHLIDYILYGMGKTVPVSVMAIGGKYAFPDDAMETPDTMTAVYDFKDFTMIWEHTIGILSLIHISEPTRLRRISYAVFCLKKKK